MMMVLDFDVKTFCQNLRATKPPYECPVKNCGKIYKSFCGIQFHLYNYDHENPTSQHTPPTSKTRRKKGRWHPRQNRRSPSPPDQSCQESLRYTEPQKVVEVDLDGHVHQLNVCEPLDIIFYEGPVNEVKTEQKPQIEVKPEKVTKAHKNSPLSKNRKDASASKEVKLPEASFRVLPDYDAPDAPPMPSAYYRFIEKSVEELDEDVEYDMDEEDCAWLDLMNQKRENLNISEISADTFELLMDRLEKESYFQSQTTGKDPNPSIDEDAVCCICNDGECQNSNAILFCDMCNLAVHQECYGVPYIPEGQWLCRRCLQSPSRAVDCVLCPNKGGAFKQTDDARWAHVVCALWIPEVCFANTVFLEPLDNIENIPPARWKLTCYICKQKSVGACIQCHKANCYTAFHVTCAQQAGLYMKMEAVRESGMNGTSYNVRKTAYCDVHAPADNDNTGDEDCGRTDSFKKAKAKAKSREKMRKARKILAEKRSAVPVVSLPTIPPDRLTKVSCLVSMPKKQQFLERLLSYWTLKRQSRNGVPLLRRLQTAQQARREPELDKECGSLGEQLQYWQRLRQDLEKARLLVELIRKREKLKREWIRMHQQVTEMQLQPLIVKLREVVELLQEKDAGEIFAKPVDLEEVPDYLDYIKHPMDFETMMKKVNDYQYSSFDDFEGDFNLIVKNCMTYNSKDTVFFKAAMKMREQGGFIMRDARKRIEAANFDFRTGLLREKMEPVTEIKMELDSVAEESSRSKTTDPETENLEEQLKCLYEKFSEVDEIEHKITRSRRTKQLHLQIVKLRRRIAIRASGCHRKRKLKEDASSDTEKVENEGDVETSPKLRGKTRKISESEVSNSSPVPKRKTRAAHNDSSQESLSVDVEFDSDATTLPSPSVISPAARNLRNSPAASKTKSDESRIPISRPPRKCLRYFRKTSPPPPALVKTDKAVNKATSSSPPTLTNASTSESGRGAKPKRESSTPSSKGVSPPVLKPQVPLLDISESESEDPKGHRKDDISPVRTSSRIRTLRASVSSPSKGKVMEVDLEGTESEEPPDASKEIETRSKSTRAQTRSQSESDATSPNRKNQRKSRASSVAGEAEVTPQKKRTGNLSSASNSATAPFSTSALPQTDSFKVYRSNTQDHGTDSDNNTNSSSESVRSSSASSSGSSSEEESDGEDPGDKVSIGGNANTSPSASQNDLSSEWNAEEQQHLILLQPLDLVWAKCRGYPWYPALIIEPKIPSSTENCHNGVPIPVPPKDVLALKDNYEGDVFLVLFFDTKRTWQWLPRDKLAPLGVDSALDKARLVESKKATERKAVKKAFENAILHRCRVTGESTSISGDSGNDN